MRPIYLDYNATSPVLPEVSSRLGDWVARLNGNPSSIHFAGREAREAIESARESLADSLNAEAAECLYFMGSATEANALALEGQASVPHGKKRVLCSAIEHPSVIRTMEAIARRHNLTFEVLPVTADGCVDVKTALDRISSDVLVCAVMLVNNEIGTIQPVHELSALCKANGVSLHVDAVQAVGRVAVDIEDLGADTLTLSGHKIGGLRGAAVLYARPGLRLTPLYFGGKQERGLRPGTENTVAIVSLLTAFEVAEQSRPTLASRLAVLRNDFENRLIAADIGARINGHAAPRVANTSSVCFDLADSFALVQALDRLGVHCSSGSACASGAVSPSPVLLAMGMSREAAFSSVRFSFGWGSVESDSAAAAEAVTAALVRTRQFTVTEAA